MTSIHQIYHDSIKAKSCRSRPQDSSPLVGSCQEMCPRHEINFRSKNHLIHPMETLTPFISLKRADRKPVMKKMVKEYSRPAADKKVHLRDVRTFEVLVETTEYLLGLVSSYQHPSQWPTVYSFVADRFRAIRQDLIVQQLNPRQIILLLESQIPFYLNARKHCEDFKMQAYDKKLHNSETDECFSRWFEAVKHGGESSPEILDAYVYYYLSKENVVYDVIEVLGFTEKAERLVKVVLWYFDRNYARFFQIFKEIQIDFVRNALWIHIGSMRLEALIAFRQAFGAKGITFPLELLASMLAYGFLKPLEECLYQLFEIPATGISIPFSFFGLNQRSIESSHLSNSWFSL